MKAKFKDVLEAVGSNSRTYANRIGCRTSALARTIGPKRGGIALGVLAGVIALPFIVRAIMSRRRQELSYEDQLRRWGARPERRRRRAARRNYAEPSAYGLYT